MAGEGFWLPLVTETSTTVAAVSDLHGVEIADDCLFWSVSPHGAPQGVWDAETNCTWVAFLKDGGDLYATYYDHATGEIAIPVLVATFPFGSGADFHHVPAVMLADDGKMHIIYGGHNAEAHRHYRMNTARTLSGWTAQTLNAGTYPFACTTDDGELIFMERPGSTHSGTFPSHEYGSIYRCTDGSTWTRTAAIDTTGSPDAASDFYQGDIMWADGLVHIVWTVARGAAHGGDRIDIHYAAFDPDTSTWYAADGTNLGSLITWAEHTTCRVVASDGDVRNPRVSLAWHRGGPVVAACVQDDVDGSTCELVVHTWNGAAWVASDIIETTTTTNQPALVSTPDELTILAKDDGLTIQQWRLVDGVWEPSGLLLRSDGDDEYTNLTPVRGGPAMAVVNRYDNSAGWPGNDDTVVGDLALITRPLSGTGGGEHSHDADYADTDHTHTLVADDVRDAGRWEVVVDGNPATAVTTPDGTDWVYGWITG